MIIYIIYNRSILILRVIVFSDEFVHLISEFRTETAKADLWTYLPLMVLDEEYRRGPRIGRNSNIARSRASAIKQKRLVTIVLMSWCWVLILNDTIKDLQIALIAISLSIPPQIDKPIIIYKIIKGFSLIPLIISLPILIIESADQIPKLFLFYKLIGIFFLMGTVVCCFIYPFELFFI